MMHRLIALCLQHRGAVAALTLLLIPLCGWMAYTAPLDVFPEFTPSSVDIQTEAPGFAPEQVEQLITRPIEDAINGAPGLATLRSQSIPGLSVITVTFEDNADVYNARQGISERLSEAETQLPLGVGPPRLSPLVSSTMDLLLIGLVSDKLDPYTLRDRADWLLKPRLLSVPGVARVSVFGGNVRQIQIQPDMQKLASYGLTLTDLADAARGALALRGAGFIDLKTQRVILQTPTPAPDPLAIGKAVLTTRNNTPVLIQDVARVEQAPALRFGDAQIMDKRGVLLSLSSQFRANTLDVTRAVEATLAGVAPSLKAEGVAVYPRLLRPANFIERALGNLETAIAMAAILILAVLYLFLRDWRSSLITFLAIPLSLFAAIAVLDWRGYTLNTMTLGGFAVALGVLVDDAIIGIENVLRRLRENASNSQPRSQFDVILDASLEVRRPVIYATLVAITVFLPELFSSTLQGHFVGPLALSFILAVLASLAVALTTTPALCMLLLDVNDTHAEPRWLTRLKQWQAHGMEIVESRTSTSLAILGLLTAAAVALLPFLGGTLIPDFKEGHFAIQVTSAVPGTSLDETLRIGKRIEDDILRLPYVATVVQQAGRAELSEDTFGTHRSEFQVELKPDTDIDQETAADDLRTVMSKYPGLQTEVVTFLGDRISESLTGESAAVALKIYGPDLNTLDRVGGEITQAISPTPGIVDLQFTRQSDTPYLTIQLSPDALAANGLKVQDALDAIQSDYAGATLGQTYVDTRTVDVALLLPEGLRNRPDGISSLMIGGAFGSVPLSAVARVTPAEGRYSINHDGGQRVVSVTFNVSGRSLQSVMSDVRSTIARSVSLPPPVYVEYAGAGAEEQRARTELLLYAVLALGLIVILLVTCFRWRAHAWLVLANLPFSLIGAVFAIAVSGIGLTLGALVGLVTVFGVSARNAILLLAHYEQLVEDEGLSWNPSTIVRGAQERLIPILMTAAVTALGLLPLALEMNRPGQEIEGPMALTVLGGLISSTLLNLVLLPALTRRFGGPHERTTPQ
ncbi:MAG: efflux RND transporter permease subunit [Alphaproteobacteria bacterium]|nr:efflux RND transporter permease subunit [Alphaproteobacteria bacterium]